MQSQTHNEQAPFVSTEQITEQMTEADIGEIAEDMTKSVAVEAANAAGGPAAGEATRLAIDAVTQANADPQAAAKLSEQVASQSPASLAKGEGGDEEYDYSMAYGY